MSNVSVNLTEQESFADLEDFVVRRAPVTSDNLGDITLTRGQEQASEMLSRFFLSDESYASIVGSAGTGKTTMLHKSLEFTDVSNIVFCAPTNKAADVLRKALPGAALVMTLHKFLGLSVKYVKGVPVSYKRDNYDPYLYEGISVVEVDEASMLDDVLMGHIADDIKAFGRQYIFIGDHCQLPPIEGKLKYSGSFEAASEDFTVRLTEIVRQAADNPIIKVATAIRDAIDRDEEPVVFEGVNPETGQGVFLLDRLDFNAKLEEIVSSPRIHTDVDYCRVVAWKNKTCRTVNKHVRKLLGEDTSRPFSVGDTVIVNSAFEHFDKIIVGTGDEVLVRAVAPHTHPLYDFASWEVDLRTIKGQEDLPKGLYCIDDDDVEKLGNELDRLKDDALRDRSLWYKFYALKNYYIDVRPPYAITAHKAQGSTFEHVFIHYKDIYENRRKITADKCFYVAVTRASQNVYILY